MYRIPELIHNMSVIIAPEVYFDYEVILIWLLWNSSSKMQAITTLHAQLCLATEKLETAQNLLIAQKSEISNIEEEGRIKQTEIKELSELLISSKEDERLELEKLGELKSQALPLEIEFERVSGAMEVLPFAFRKLSEDFSLPLSAADESASTYSPSLNQMPRGACITI